MIVNASSKRSTRWSNGKPNARNSVSFQPAPRPRISRPPQISSIVEACLASSAGLWKSVHATSGPNSTRVVAAAMAASIVHASHGPRAGPVGPAVEEVLAEPDRVEAEVLDRPGHVEQLRPADLALDLGQLDADLERARPLSRPLAAAATSASSIARRWSGELPQHAPMIRAPASRISSACRPWSPGSAR